VNFVKKERADNSFSSYQPLTILSRMFFSESAYCARAEISSAFRAMQSSDPCELESLLFTSQKIKFFL